MPKFHDTQEDKNFDDLAHHFQKNIYGQLKGEIRLAVIERDLKPYLGSKKVVIDAGGGQGQLAMKLAQQGHEVDLCDISEKMLDIAKNEASKRNLNNIRFVQSSLQEVAEKNEQKYDIVMCHAVLEWLAQPEQAIASLSALLKPDGILSLAFFNKHSIVFKNLVRANYFKVQSDNYVGMEGGLTPLHPLVFEDVTQWCETEGLSMTKSSGIRVFHDYIGNKETRSRHPEAQKEMELKYSEIEPFKHLGRYIHLLVQKPSN